MVARIFLPANINYEGVMLALTTEKTPGASGQFAGIASKCVVARLFERGHDRHIFFLRDKGHQPAAHPPACTVDCDSYHVISPSREFLSPARRVD